MFLVLVCNRQVLSTLCRNRCRYRYISVPCTSSVLSSAFRNVYKVLFTNHTHILIYILILTAGSDQTEIWNLKNWRRLELVISELLLYG